MSLNESPCADEIDDFRAAWRRIRRPPRGPVIPDNAVAPAASVVVCYGPNKRYYAYVQLGTQRRPVGNYPTEAKAKAAGLARLERLASGERGDRCS
jgi:hypothetical protein